MMSAMNVMFNLIVVNNWTTCEGGYEAVTGGKVSKRGNSYLEPHSSTLIICFVKPKMVRFFFFSFHIVGVVLVNNIVMAFVINAFLSHLRDKKSFRQRQIE